MTNLLQLKNITKKYPGVIALDDVSFNIEKGSILSLVGENGAGKSTILKIISGVIPYNKFSGEIYFNNQKSCFASVKDSEKKGIAIIHQELAYQPHLTLTENIFQGNYLSFLGIVNWNMMNKRAKFFLKMVGLKKKPSEKASNLSIAELQLLEIAKALSKEAKLLILDEPTSSLNDKESFELLNIIKGLKKKGVTCMFVSHKLNEVEYIADSITVIRDGKFISNYNNKNSKVTEEKLIRDIVGRSLKSKFPNKKKNKKGKKVLEVINLSVDHDKIRNKNVVRNSSFEVYAGEIVGISGLVGSGRSELALNVFGKSFGKRTSGKILLKGQEDKMNSVSQSIKKGLMYATENRKETGLIQMFSIHYNINSASTHLYSNKFGIINKNKEIINSRKLKYEVGIKVPNIDYKVETLSGGNQQKVLIAKALSTKFEVIIIDEPTKGIDVGSKFEIYKIIQELAEKGKAIVIISSEIEELLGMTDKIFVMSQGVIKDSILTKNATSEKIMEIAIGQNHKNVERKNERHTKN